MTFKGNSGTPEAYPSFAELPLLLELLYPVESQYSSIAFSVLLLDEGTNIFGKIEGKSKDEKGKKYLALRQRKAMDAEGLLDGVLDEKCLEGKF